VFLAAITLSRFKLFVDGATSKTLCTSGALLA
jgi:hypothetical protein